MTHCCCCVVEIFFQRAKSVALASMLSFSCTLVAGPLWFTIKIGHPGHHKLGSIGHTVASGQPPSEGWRPGGETYVFARTSWLFGVCGKHTLPPDRHSCWLCLFRKWLFSVISLWLSSAFNTLPDDLPPKQPFCDRPGILADVARVKSSLSTPAQLASFLAASSPHSGEWLQAMPISSCGLRLDDEAVRIGVDLRLGSTLDKCHCGALVDAQGLHKQKHLCLQEGSG